jgi:hypothetical protein
MDSSAKMKFRAKETTTGQTENPTQDNGLKTKWTDKELLHGGMGKSTKDSF